MPALKNQHFVPKCLLRPFTIAGNDRAINLYNIRSKRPITNAPIKGQCARDYLYGKDGKIEEMLASAESRYSAIMRGIIDGVKETDGDLDNLRFVTYLQLRRTEMAVERSREMYEQMHAGVYGDDVEDTSMPTTHQLVIQSLKMCMETHTFISDLKPRLIENRSKAEFVISDDPSVFTNRYAFQRLKDGSFGVGSSGVMFLMPLTPRLCFVCYDGQVYTVPDTETGRIVLKKDSDVEAVNEFQYLKAAENVYFSRWEDREYIKTSFEALRERRPTQWSQLKHLVFDGMDELGERYVLGTREEAMQARHSMIQVSSRHVEPTRWLSAIKFRSSPKTFSNGSAAGPLRKAEWLTARMT